MKITISPVVAGPAWGTEVSLTTGLEKSPEHLIYNGTNAVDMVQVLESASQVPIDRGNQATSITFGFTKDNASFNASERDLILYFASLPRFGKITFYAEGAIGVPFAYMVGAVNLTHSQIGVATIRNFTFTGSPITTSEPSPPLPGPTEPPAPIEKVLKADATSADAYVTTDFGSDQSEVWVSFGLGFTTAAMVAWGTDGSGFFALVMPSDGTTQIGGIFEVTESGPTPNWFLSGGSSSDETTGPPPPVPDAWQNCELHVHKTSNTLVEFYSGGTLVATFTDAEALALRKLSVGHRSATGANNIAYIRRVRVGTTRGAADLFSDDFASGDLAAWDSVNGNCSVVNDPF